MSEIAELPVASGPKPKENGIKKTSRRRFFRMAAIATAGVLAASVMPKAAPESLPVKPAEKKPLIEPPVSLKEQKESLPPPLILDVFLSDKIERDFLEKHFPGFSEAQLLEKMGVINSQTVEGLAKAETKDLEELKFLMLKAFKLSYQNHGKNVLDTVQKTADYLGAAEDQPTSVPILNAIEIEDEITYDSSNNPVIHVKINPEALEEAIKTSNSEVVNLSFELGRFAITYNKNHLVPAENALDIGRKLTGSAGYYYYEGIRIPFEEYQRLREQANKKVIEALPIGRGFSFVDGYVGEETENNLRALTDLARKFPEKTFFAAAGNATYSKMPDIREARAKLAAYGLWPPNLIMVGVLEELGLIKETGANGTYGINDVPGAMGADLYLVGKNFKDILKKSPASSFATPAVMEVYYQLRKKGCSQKEAKAVLLSELVNFSHIENQDLLDHLNKISPQPVTPKDKLAFLDLEKAKKFLAVRN